MKFKGFPVGHGEVRQLLWHVLGPEIRFICETENPCFLISPFLGPMYGVVTTNWRDVRGTCFWFQKHILKRLYLLLLFLWWYDFSWRYRIRLLYCCLPIVLRVFVGVPLMVYLSSVFLVYFVQDFVLCFSYLNR